MAISIQNAPVEVNCEVGEVSNADSFIVYSTVSGQTRAATSVSLHGADKTRVRLSLDGVTWAVPWGDPLSIGTVTESGAVVYFQVRSIDADLNNYDDLDTNTDMIVVLSGVIGLPQDNIAYVGGGQGTVICTSSVAAATVESANPAYGIITCSGVTTGVVSNIWVIASPCLIDCTAVVTGQCSAASDTSGTVDVSSAISGVAASVTPCGGGTVSATSTITDDSSVVALNLLAAPSLSDVTAGDALITFTVTDDITGETSFQAGVFQTDGTTQVGSSFTVTAGIGKTTSGNVTLTNGTGYKIRLRTINGAGNGPWGTASSTVTPAAASGALSGVTRYLRMNANVTPTVRTLVASNANDNYFDYIGLMDGYVRARIGNGTPTGWVEKNGPNSGCVPISGNVTSGTTGLNTLVIEFVDTLYGNPQTRTYSLTGDEVFPASSTIGLAIYTDTFYDPDTGDGDSTVMELGYDTYAGLRSRVVVP